MSVLPEHFRRNVITSYVYTFTAAAIALVMTPVLLNGLGTEAYGIWVVVGSLVFYFEVFEFGFGKAVPKYVAEYAAASDWERVRSAVATAFWMLAGFALVALAVGVALALVFPDVFDAEADLRSAAQLLVLVVVVDLAVSIPGDTFGGVLMGLQRFDIINLSLVVVAVLQAAAWAIVLATGGGLVELGLVTVALSLAGQLSRYLAARRLVPQLTVLPRHARRAMIRPFAGLSAWLAIVDIANLVVIRLDIVVVGLGAGLAAAGIYAVGQKLTLSLEYLMVPATRMFFPHSSRLRAQRDADALTDTVVAGTRIALLIALPTCLAFAVLAEPVIDGWVGREAEGAADVVVYLAAAVSIAALTRTGMLVLQGSGDARTPAVIIAAEALLNLGLSIVLVQTMGLEGVALATLIASAAMNLGFLLPYICRRLGLSLQRFAGSVIRAHALPLAVASAVAWSLRAGEPDGLLQAVAAVGAVVATYVAVFGFTGLDADERRRLLRAVRP